MSVFDPKATVKGAAHLIWRNPSLLFWQVCSSLLSSFARGAVLVGIALVLAVVIGISVRNGQGFDGLFGFLSRPDFLLGAFGLGFTSWLFGFALDAFVWAGTWRTTARHLQNEPVRFFDDAFAQFPRAVWQRAVVMLHDLGIIAMFGTILIATTAAVSWLGWGIWGAAAMWGASLTFYAVLAILLRLTASVAAAGMFIEGRSWPDAWLSAAQSVLASPLAYYRTFILSAYALLPAFLVYYVAIFVFNLTVGTPFQPLGELTRLGAEFVMIVGFAAFMLLTQVSFFNAYHHQGGSAALPLPLKPIMTERTPPNLTDLLPQKVPFRVNVDTLEQLPISPNIDRESEADAVEESEAPDTNASPQDYDLEAVLRKKDDEPNENPPG